MSKAVFALLLLCLIPAKPATACDDDGITLNGGWCEAPAHWGALHDARDARLAIHNRDRRVTLLLTNRVVAVQLSERTLRRVNDKFRDEENEDDNVLAHAIKVAVFSTVRDLLRHSVECPIRDLRDVDYRGGRLVFVTEDGDRLFDDISLHDQDLMSDFSPADSRAFVRAFRRLKGAQRW